MGSTKRSATMENLPIDILSDIFIRLLAKQLAQMRCVSKSWNALLSHSSFVKSHLNRSIHNNDEVVLVFYNEFSFNSKPFTAHPSRTPFVQLTNLIKLPVNLLSEVGSTRSKVIGSVNGLICFTCTSYVQDPVVYIWNPSLSAMLTLPPYYIPSHHYYSSIEINLRFGFDPKADDYKVVKLTSRIITRTSHHLMTSSEYVDDLLYGAKEWLQVEVYSMRKGSWEFITQRFPPHITYMHWPEHEVFVDGLDGHLHWLGHIDKKRKLLAVVAFDLSLETFREIPLPDSIRDYNGLRSSKVLGVLSGKLCVISSVGYGKCEIWVMDEYGVTESWVKHHVFSTYTEITPFGFTLRNEFLYEAFVANEYDESDFHTYLALYDLIEGNSKIFKHSSQEHGPTKIVEYVDSLVWVAPAK